MIFIPAILAGRLDTETCQQPQQHMTGQRAPKVPGWGCQPLNPAPSDAPPQPADGWQGLSVLGQFRARFIYSDNTHTNRNV